MIRKGYNFKPAPHLDFRMADPLKDFDDTGRPIDSNYIIIFSRKDKEQKPLFPHRHSRTNMVYGVRRKHERASAVWKVTLPIYWVENGKVYQTTSIQAEGHVPVDIWTKYCEDRSMMITWKERMKDYVS